MAKTKRKGTTPEAQQELPGVMTEVKKIAPLTRILKRYLSARAEYADAGRRANDEKISAIAMMKEHGITEYPVGKGWFKLHPGKEKLDYIEGGDDEDENATELEADPVEGDED